MKNSELLKTYLICGVLKEQDLSEMITDLESIDNDVSIKEYMDVIIKNKDKMIVSDGLDLANIIINLNDTNRVRLLDKAGYFINKKIQYCGNKMLYNSLKDILDETYYNKSYTSRNIEYLLNKEKVCMVKQGNQLRLGNDIYLVDIAKASVYSNDWCYFNLVNINDTLRNIGMIVIENDSIRVITEDTIKNKKDVIRIVKELDVTKVDLIIILNMCFSSIMGAWEKKIYEQ